MIWACLQMGYTTKMQIFTGELNDDQPVDSGFFR